MVLILSILPIIDILIYRSTYILTPQKEPNFNKIFIINVIVPMSYYALYAFIVYIDITPDLSELKNPHVDYITLTLSCIGLISLYMYNIFYFSNRFKYIIKKLLKNKSLPDQYYSC